jgi:hypothetical protein
VLIHTNFVGVWVRASVWDDSTARYLDTHNFFYNS